MFCLNIHIPGAEIQVNSHGKSFDHLTQYKMNCKLTELYSN